MMFLFLCGLVALVCGLLRGGCGNGNYFFNGVVLENYSFRTEPISAVRCATEYRFPHDGR